MQEYLSNLVIDNVVWIIVLISLLIILNNVLWFIKYKKLKKTKAPIEIKSNITFKEVQKDLMEIINYKCYVANRNELQPYVKKALKTTPLINDKVVKKITIRITNELISELSDVYLAKLRHIYKKDKIEDVLLELVYNVIVEMSLDINKKSIKRMNTIRSFKTIARNDIDE